MSYADDVFIKMCQDILENGTSTEGEKDRPVREIETYADIKVEHIRSRNSEW